MVISDGSLDYFASDMEAMEAAEKLETDCVRPEEFVDRATAFALERGLEDGITVVVLHRRA